MKTIILLFGEAHSGKDTTLKYIKEYLKNDKISVYFLSEKLKKFCYQLLKIFKNDKNIDISWFYNDLEKEKIRKNLGYLYPNNIREDFSIRRLMQIIGTDITRNNIDKEIWLDLAKKHIVKSKDKYIIVPDCRFQNETVYFQNNLDESKYLIKSIKITRKINKMSNKKSLNHSSESGIKNIKCDYIINNNGTLKDLENYINNILYKISLLN